MKPLHALLLAGLAVLAACSKPEPAPAPVRAVRTLTVAPQSAGGVQEYAGEVRARTESRLGFRVGGKIVRRDADLGDNVKAGQLLAQLDPQDLRLGQEAAKAALSAAQVNHDQAAADFKRFKELRDQGFISSAELERRETALKAALAQLEQARAQSSVQGNQAAYASLLADAKGAITAVEAEPGMVVAAGTPVLRLAHDGPRDVVFAVPEDKLARVPAGSTVTVRPWSGGAALSGTVREVAASADPVTRTFPVKVTLPASGGADALPLGATVYVVPQPMAPQATGVIKLPTSALRQEGRGSAVWVLDPATLTVRSQPVQIATADGNEVVIASGLQPGQQVVSTGVHVLSPGQKVTIYKPNGANPSADRQPAAIKTGASGAASMATPALTTAASAPSAATATR